MRVVRRKAIAARTMRMGIPTRGQADAIVGVQLNLGLVVEEVVVIVDLQP